MDADIKNYDFRAFSASCGKALQGHFARLLRRLPRSRGSVAGGRIQQREVLMKTRSFLLAAGIVLAMAFTSVSAEVSNTDIPLNTNQKTSVYLHPVRLITGFVENAFPFMFYLTGEFPFNERYALIVDPFLMTKKSTYTTARDYNEVFAIGSGIGIRRFVNGNADGFYLQLIPNISYWEMTDHWEDWIGTGQDGKAEYEDKAGDASAINVDVLGYIGYSIKYSKINLFFDIGIGYGFTHYLSRSEDYPDDYGQIIRIHKVGFANGLSIDINIGVGIPLL